ncbi:MAG: hypothetical protein ACRC0A_06675 [Chitinophagaceae bacterium]
MKKIVFSFSLLCSMKFIYAQEFLLQKEWKAKKSISNKIDQMFTLVFTKQKTTCRR